MTNRPDLSRRKLLWGLTTIGAAATTGSSTAALLHDSAQTSAEMSAGTLDLSAAWGNDDSTTEATVESTTEGDSGEKRITLTVDDSPAYICFRTDCPGNSTDEQSRIDRNRTASDANRTDTARKRGTVSPDGRPDGTSSWGNAAPNQDRWNQKRDRSTSVDDRYQATSVEERLFVRYGIDRGDGSGVEWVSSYMMLLEARTTFGEGYCLEGELGPDDTWEFVVQWKADDVVMNTTDVEFDFEFYASQTRHVDSDTVDPDWECGTGGGTGTDGGRVRSAGWRFVRPRSSIRAPQASIRR
ncbi:hypothetical protein ACFQL0_07685 [Haloplanus litoreus]|uniref:hypothetical protein n=1 Tax=Haloplanus litoreus TaxID=767515 RepID=UPI00361353CF